MGAVLAAPLSALGTCLGGACGTCLAAGCCKLANAGDVSNARAARCVVLWLQVFTSALAWILSTTAVKWLKPACVDGLSKLGWQDLGVCKCHLEDDSCWKNQTVFRVEASGGLLFLALAVLAVSGCAKGAARTHTVAKFMAVVFLAFLFLFLENSIFSGFGTVVTSASAIFLLMQAILLIDFAYTWNENWYANALRAQRERPSGNGYAFWTRSMIAASLLLLLGSWVGTGLLCSSFMKEWWLLLTTPVLCLLLLFVSTLECVKHGALLTSCVVAMYVLYMCCEALAVMPSQPRLEMPSWVGLLLCGFSLFTAAAGAGGLGIQERAEEGGGREDGLVEAGEAGDARSVASADEGMTAEEARTWAAQCAIHASAVLFITAEVAPSPSSWAFGLRSAAVYLVIILYGWTLIAPKVLTNRTF